MAAIDDVVNHIMRLEYVNLPASTVEVVKKTVLDTLGVLIAGSSAPGCAELVKLVKTWGGRGEASLLIYGGKVPAHHAALVNSTVARARDLGDVHPIGGHLSESTVPAAFVFAEYAKAFKGKPMDGKSFIMGNALCSDLTTRLRAAGKEVGIRRHRAETLAPISVAAMGAKLFGFDEAKLRHAMGLGYTRCCGNAQSHIDGALATRLWQGLSAEGGVFAVMLADAGFTGARDIFEGEYGLYPLYMQGEFDAKELTGELGKRFEVNNVGVKLYPSCLGTHGAIDGALSLAKERDIKPEDVEKVTVATNNFGYQLCGFGKNKVAPRNVVDAQFSYYYTVATALTKRKVFIDDFTEEAIKNEKVLALAQKVEVVVDEEKDKFVDLTIPVDIRIEMRNGEKYEKDVVYVKGHPSNPLSFEECAQKLRDCARFSVTPIPGTHIESIIDLVKRLETLPDVIEVIKPLLGP
ncbi:MAG: MmgE/PrpD family protein [Chloroflexi bacterium]|nr:MmgE/PrpD family protein [Chloroflexota bacterium]